MRQTIRATFFAVAIALLLASPGEAAEIKVMISGGFNAAYSALSKEFEQKSGDTISTVRGPSMGETPEAIPNRLLRGEPADVLIMVGSALDGLVQQGKVVADSWIELARSNIGIAVRAGASKPDIGTVEALKKALVAARSIAYSDSASGVYVSTVLFERLGIAEEVKGKARMIPAEPVGAVVARGDAEIGFQQISELLPVAGIAFVGPLPPEVQKVTVFSGGVATNAKEPERARALLKFLGSPDAIPVIMKTGLDPPTPHAKSK
jgi:molybdate transport system substrate-binding protein